MNNTSLVIPKPVNEPVLSYAPGTPERARLQAKLAEMKQQAPIDIPAFIGGQEVFTGNTETVSPPHEHQHVLGTVHNCAAPEVEKAIAACREARQEWMNMPWTDRAAIFLRAATLLAGPWRETINAATMLGQSKNPHQAEIDSACELIDFLRFNAYYMAQIYADQPYSPTGIWNQLQYRPLEGFVLAVTPFNFTAIQGNLCAAPAMMGNTVIWKPSTTAIYSAYYVYKLFEEAGLPAGVINMLPGFGPDIGDPAMASPEFAGLHFTGSTRTFNTMWQTIGSNINTYRATRALWARQAVKTSFWHTQAPTLMKWRRLLYAAVMNTRAKNAPPHRACMCQSRCGRAFKPMHLSKWLKSRSAQLKTSRTT